MAYGHPRQAAADERAATLTDKSPVGNLALGYSGSARGVLSGVTS